MAVAAAAVGLFLWYQTSSNPKTVFESWAGSPVPTSVQSIKVESMHTMDSVFRMLRFEINTEDQRNLLNKLHFVPIDEGKEFKQWDTKAGDFVSLSKADYFRFWHARIQNTIHSDVSFTTDWQIFVRTNGSGEEHWFCDTNRSEAVVILDAH
jgi:hypothetical protein